MTHIERLIRSDELDRYRNGGTPITLPKPYVPTCEYDDLQPTANCVNSVCRWGGACTLAGDAKRRLH